MANRCMLHRTALVLASWLLICAPSAALAQDVLSRAKSHYASAEYEEALQLLEALKGKAASTEAAAYQVFCLVALSRQGEARVVIEAIVRTDPMFRPSAALVAPRIRAFFDEVRKPLLPEVARQSYAKAKAAFDKKDWAPAIAEFDRVIQVLDEIGGADRGVADLKTLAAGFRELARAVVPPPLPKPEPTVAPVSPPPVTPAEPAIYGAQHANVTAPVPVSRHYPAWRPSFFELNMTFSGDLELVISEEGKVLSASLLKTVHPRYDGPLLEAAKSWTFKPATKNGVPVKYRYVMAIQILK